MAVHPHERGEYGISRGDSSLLTGSSPRTWGILSRRFRSEKSHRFIPTNVGNTWSRRTRPRRRAVHPHERGEYFEVLPPRRRAGGSSPRTWGIRVNAGGVVPYVRFIPTNVGNTDWKDSEGLSPPVHPHERGEYGLSFPETGACGGSSPRTWGIHLLTDSRPHLFRFIPTNVGNTHFPSSFMPRPAVHPHERGEYSRRMSGVASIVGSSPRTWGILHALLDEQIRMRFIPTNVGNTFEGVLENAVLAVHPHERGEYVLAVRIDSNFPRFIPTNVGNTRSVTSIL